ncbi:MAG: type IX secretion system protein PorQ [Muribaculaceae bacterium]|nr:type IX secretion system protein PorQ [Muribaculaceae bacterium]
MMRFRLIHIALIALGSLIITPATVQARGAGDAYSFLDIPTSSHVFGLGGTNISIIDDDVTLGDQNPALIGPELEKQIAVNYMYYMSSGNFAGVRFGTGAGEHSAWAVGLRYLNYGKFDGYDEFGTPTGSFTPSDLVIEGTYSRDITDRWRGGANLKFAYSSYENYSAFAIAADLGVNYYDDEHDLSLSAVLRNMGGQVKRFDKRYNRVPFDFQLGYMQSIGSSPFQISITATDLTRWRIPYYEHKQDQDDSMLIYHDGFFTNFFRHLIFGLQYQPSEKFYACLGYNYRTRTDMSAYQASFLSGFSLGLGFKTRGFSVAASYAYPHKSASSLMVNLALSIGELMR